MSAPVRVRRASAAVAALVAAVLVGVVTPASAATPDSWSSTSGGPGNAMDNAGESVITASTAGRLTKRWQSDLRGDTPYVPVIAGGVVYRVLTVNAETGTGVLTATSATTGATVWQLPLPAGRYEEPAAVTGRDLVLDYRADQFSSPGGVLLVDTITRRIVWQKHLPPPPSALSGLGYDIPGEPYTDGARIYVPGFANLLSTYRLGDGALLWTIPMTLDRWGTYNAVDGVAEDGGVVYTAGHQGLLAYDGATGHRLWSAPGRGRPVVAAGRVFVVAGNLFAYRAGGCGAPTCSPLWTRSLPGTSEDVQIGGADASTLFLTYRQEQPSTTRTTWTGNVARLSATTGALQWHVTVGDYTQGLVRGGNTIWFYDEYTPPGSSEAVRILGYSTTATTGTPLRSIALPTAYEWFPQNLAIASGTLVEQANGGPLVGYRIPGT